MRNWIHKHAHCLVCSSSSILCWWGASPIHLQGLRLGYSVHRDEDMEKVLSSHSGRRCFGGLAGSRPPRSVLCRHGSCPAYYTASLDSVEVSGSGCLGRSPWPQGLLYAFPPVVLMLSLIHGVRAEWRAVIEVVPVALWSSWFPLMVRLAIFPPWLVPLRQGAIPRRGVSSIARPYFGGARLVVWLARG